jgi:AAA family ATP:ADP antiporter
MNVVWRRLGWALPATPRERAAALWSFAYFFTLLAGYYVLRPLRDQMGIAGGVKNLPWLFTATFVTLIAAQPAYGALVAKLPRARFISLVYHFFVANIVLFWLFLTLGIAPVIVARVFFVWVSVFSLFAVAVFWSFMADLFTAEQGKRLFGFIGAGGTAGGLLGPIITLGLSVPLGAVNLLIVAAVLLELAVFCVHRLERAAVRQAGVLAGVHAEPGLVGGSAFAALPELLRSPYLLGVGAWVSLLSFCATIVYFEQANIIAAAVHDRDTQTRIFAGIDLAVNLLSLATQLLLTGRAQALRHRRRRRRAARRLCDWLRRAVCSADSRRRGGLAGGAALDEFRLGQSGTAGVLHRARARGEVQGKELDRCRYLSRL